MVIRSWEGRTRPGAGDQYLVYLSENIIPEIRSLPGCLGARVLRGVNDSDRFVVQTHWTDVESIVRFAGADPELAVVPPDARALLAEFEDRASHFDVVFDHVTGAS